MTFGILPLVRLNDVMSPIVEGFQQKVRQLKLTPLEALQLRQRKQRFLFIAGVALCASLWLIRIIPLPRRRLCLGGPIWGIGWLVFYVMFAPSKAEQQKAVKAFRALSPIERAQWYEKHK